MFTQGHCSLRRGVQLAWAAVASGEVSGEPQGLTSGWRQASHADLASAAFPCRCRYRANHRIPFCPGVYSRTGGGAAGVSGRAGEPRPETVTYRRLRDRRADGSSRHSPSPLHPPATVLTGCPL